MELNEEKTPREIQAEKRNEALIAAEAKAEQLSATLNKKVTPIVLGDEGEFVGFIAEPKLQAKKAAFDKISLQKTSDAGEILLTTSLLKEESAPEFQFGKNDDIYLSACIACVRMVRVYANASKKK